MGRGCFHCSDKCQSPVESKALGEPLENSRGWGGGVAGGGPSKPEREPSGPGL